MNAQALRVEEQAAPYLVAPVLTDQLDTFAIAPEGFKRLRGLVLDLAVRGRLVPQDPDDEPATVLLEQIDEERSMAVARVKPMQGASDCGAACAIPNSWECVPLGSIVLQISDGTHHTPTYQSEGVAFISVKDIDGRTVSFDDCKYISAKEHQVINARCNPERGDILLCRIGTLGRPTIVDTDRPFSLFVSVGLLKLPKSVSLSKYLHSVLSSPYLAGQYEAIKAGGSHTNKLNLGDIPRLLIPLPPLAEQSRIVAKVEDLMALIDRLEAKVSHGETARGKLLDALLAALADSPDAAATADAWAQLAPHFDLLLQTPADVDRLQQTLLTLAVKGRLMPQDPNDEPAGELLKRIRAEKERLVDEGKIKREKLLPAIDEEEVPYELPVGWSWSRFGHVIDVETNLVAPADYADWPQIAPDLIEKGTGKLLGNRTVAEAEIKSPNHLFRAGQIIYSKIRPSLSKAVIATFDGLCSADMYPLSVHINTRYALHYILSLGFLEQVAVAENRVKMPKLNQEALTNFFFPLPPLAEQSRIVAAVASLTALCDRLRERLAARRELSAKLATALTESALA